MLLKFVTCVEYLWQKNQLIILISKWVYWQRNLILDYLVKHLSYSCPIINCKQKEIKCKKLGKHLRTFHQFDSDQIKNFTRYKITKNREQLDFLNIRVGKFKKKIFANSRKVGSMFLNCTKLKHNPYNFFLIIDLEHLW